MWEPYIKASWDLVIESQGRTKINLRDDMQAYLVHMMARTMTDTSIPPDIICLEFLNAKTLEDYRRIGDSCLFIDAWDVKRARLVASDYYENLGKIAYEYASTKNTIMSALYEDVSKNFSFLSMVLRHVKSQKLY